MPLERYDQLILENKRMMDELDNIVTIEADWNNEPMLKIDLSILAARISEKFEQSEFASKWTLKDMSKYKETVWTVFKKIEHDEDEENQAQPLGFLFGFQCGAAQISGVCNVSAAQFRLIEAAHMYLCSYGKPARGGAAKKSISDASFRLTEAARKTVDI